MSSSVQYIKTKNQGSCLIMTPDINSPTSYIIWFDPFYGTPIFSSTYGVDLFSSSDDALAYLKNNYTVVQEFSAIHLIGMRIIGQICNIFLITKQKIKGNYLRKFPIFSASQTVLISFPINPHLELKDLPIADIQKSDELNSFKFKHCIFCRNFDISCPLFAPVNSDFIWNSFLSAPFSKINEQIRFLGQKYSLCVTLIQGLYRNYVDPTLSFDLYVFFRRRREGAGSLTHSRGLSSSSSIGCEIETEIILQSSHHDGTDIQSFIFVRSSTPQSQENVEPLSSLPSLFHRFFETYSVFSSFVIDYSTPKVSSELKSIIQQFKSAFDVSYVRLPFSNNLSENISSLYSVFTSPFKKGGYNHVFLPNSDYSIFGPKQALPDTIFKLREAKAAAVKNSKLHSIEMINNQKTIFLISSTEGIDRCAFSSFLISIKVVDEMLFSLNKFSEIQDSEQGIYSLPPNLLNFLCLTFLSAGDFFAQLIVGSETTCKPLFLPIHTFLQKSVQASPMQNFSLLTDDETSAQNIRLKRDRIFNETSSQYSILEKRRVFANNDKIHNEIINLIKGTDDYINPGQEPIPLQISRPSKNKRTDLLNLYYYPEIRFLNVRTFGHSQNVDDSIFSIVPSYTLIDTTKSLLVYIDQPSRIVEIDFRNLSFFSDDFNPYFNTSTFTSPIFDKPFPVKVSVYGGFYANRLFPLNGFQNLALMQTNSEFNRFMNITHFVYNENLDPNLYEAVRFLEFRFTSQKPISVISNIYVYGVTCPHSSIKILHTIPPVEKEPHIFNQNSSNLKDLHLYQPSLDQLFSWEQNRLCSFISNTEYEDMIIRSGFNPSLFSIGWYLKMKRVTFQNGYKCCLCGAPSSIRCNVCLHYYCKNCSDKNSLIQRTKNKSLKGIICNCCNRIQQEYANKDPMFHGLKIRMLLNLYPFILDDRQLMTSNDINAKFAYRPPDGQDGTLAEQIFGRRGHIWRPKCNLVPLTIVFPFLMELSSIVIETDYELEILIEGLQLHAKPLISIIPLNYGSFARVRVISLILSGPQISIRYLSFNGCTVPILQNSMMTIQNLNKFITPTSTLLRGRKYESIFDKNKRMNTIKFGKKGAKLFGIEFTKSPKVREIVIDYLNMNGQQKLERWNKPDQIKGAILFENPIICTEMNIWYLTMTDFFIEPEFSFIEEIKSK